MNCTVGDLVSIMDELAPRALARDWDNVGLIFGSEAQQVSAVLVALDVTMEVVEEAEEKGAGLIVCHHPPIFRPLSRVLEDSPEGALAGRIIRACISVFAAHTNLDASPQGVNAALAEAIGLVDPRPLEENPYSAAYKLVTFLPPEKLADVSRALFQAGAGVIGDYRECSFRVEGTGTFLPLEQAHPAFGERGRLNEVRESRLEVLVPEDVLAPAVEALLRSHPYEEPAFDLYPLHRPSAGGMGRVGELPRPLSLGELAEFCGRVLGCPDVRFAGEPGREIKRLAVCGGRGAELFRNALQAGAQAFLTSDVGHHEAADALGHGLAVIDAGHYYTERVIVPYLARLMRKETEKRGLEVAIYESGLNTCPWNLGGIR